MPAKLSRLVAALALATAACNATGAGPIATKAATEAPGASTAAAPTGPTAFASTTFAVRFTLTLPPGWKVFQDDPDMFAAYISTDHETADVAIDIQLVPKVNVDPCNEGGGTGDGGTTAADLSAWMLAYAPLAATAGTAMTLGGSEALVIDSAFASGPCEHPKLWPTSGGWLDASEHKRFLVFEVGGKRLVAAVASSNEKFAAQAAAGMGVLATLAFK